MNTELLLNMSRMWNINDDMFTISQVEVEGVSVWVEVHQSLDLREKMVLQRVHVELGAVNI